MPSPRAAVDTDRRAVPNETLPGAPTAGPTRALHSRLSPELYQRHRAALPSPLTPETASDSLAYCRCCHVACTLSYSVIDDFALLAIPLWALAVGPAGAPGSASRLGHVVASLPRLGVSLGAALGGAGVGGGRGAGMRLPEGFCGGGTVIGVAHGSVHGGQHAGSGTDARRVGLSAGRREWVWGRGARSLY